MGRGGGSRGGEGLRKPRIGHGAPEGCGFGERRRVVYGFMVGRDDESEFLDLACRCFS